MDRAWRGNSDHLNILSDRRLTCYRRANQRAGGEYDKVDIPPSRNCPIHCASPLFPHMSAIQPIYPSQSQSRLHPFLHFKSGPVLPGLLDLDQQVAENLSGNAGCVVL
ncbi:MAG: hypothetical protein ACXWLZ_04490, partial [Rhizomicrobium sp.]